MVTALWYASCIGKLPDFRHPKNINELLMSLNLAAKNDISTRNKIIRCADKYEVRKYVEDKGFSEILNDCYGVYDSFDDIDFSLLPNQFVLKLTTCSGMNYICKDKNKLNIDDLRKVVNIWFEKCKDFGLKTGEWHYVCIKPRLICERYLFELGEPLSLIDYKWHCFNGNVYHIETIYDRDIKRKVTNCDTYNLEWKRTECIKPDYHVNRRLLRKPKNFDKMKQVVKALSSDFKFVRVDLYEIEGKIIFGELTFTPAGCIYYDYYEEYLIDMCDFFYATENKERQLTK